MSFSGEVAAGAVLGLPVHETSQGVVLFPPGRKFFRHGQTRRKPLDGRAGSRPLPCQGGGILPSTVHAVRTPAGRSPESRCQMAEGGQAAGVSPVRLCRHGQDHACPAFRRECRWRGAVRSVYRQGGAGVALARRDQRTDHSFVDLPAARRRGRRGRRDRPHLDRADVLDQPAEPTRQGGADRH